MMQGRARRQGLALGAVLLGGLTLAHQGTGQELRLGFDQRFEANDNQTLAATSPGTTATSTSRLSFDYSTETAASVFQFGGSTLLRLSSGPGTNQNGLEDPSVRLSYTRSAAEGELSLSARATSSNIAFLRPFEDFLDPETGEFVPPEDLDELTGTGTRTGYSTSALLRLGDQARFGTTFRAGISGTDYRDVTNPSLVNNRRISAGVGLRFSMSAVTDANLDLGWSRFSNDDPLQSDRDTVTLSASLSHDRPDGRLTARVSAEKRDGSSTRFGVNIGRSYDLVRGSLSFGVGTSWGDTADRQFNGNLSWTRELPNGQIRLGLSQGLTTDSDDNTRRTTAATFGWQHQISEISSISLDLGLTENRSLGVGTSVRNATQGLGYNYKLTEDWALSAGYRRLQRDSAGVKAQSNTVFVTLRRDFVTGF